MNQELKTFEHEMQQTLFKQETISSLDNLALNNKKWI